jgi:hypothetical protein
MEASGELHASEALPWGKEPLVLTREEAEWVPASYCNQFHAKKKI